MEMIAKLLRLAALVAVVLVAAACNLVGELPTPTPSPEPPRTPQPCMAANATGVAQPIYGQPNPPPDEGLFARFQPDATFRVIGKRTGWYQIYVDALSTEGWIDATLVTLSGDCDTVPSR